LDAVINNAGIDRPGMLVDLSDEDWDAVMDVHLRAQFRVLRRSRPRRVHGRSLCRPNRSPPGGR
ncbi:MAG: SDR family oxidoreductase, partial [Deltaproteobacteria bacterium]|nr:SDR family oxidoreductase [Deltaproteobacteria bacterium]